MTGVSECSQQRGNLKDDGYILSTGKETIYEPKSHRKTSENS
ncbi:MULTISPECIES: hypothetical protein [Photorhabdus]|uniref:Lipoprotein n=1 Tax=Photorhabdus bodei TaxID=2029681 RepID=A0AAW6BG51_9GAMM|nr:hypothetical protein [Photorhabdus bodei]MDB6370824.1 hypothetical protein [Photorhabdus bodei]